MRLTDEMVELDDRKYRDRNVLVELKYMGREIKHRKTVTNDDLRFMAWLYRSALNLLKEQEPKKVEWRIGRAHCPSCGELFPRKKETQYIRFCSFCGQEVKWE